MTTTYNQDFTLPIDPEVPTTDQEQIRLLQPIHDSLTQLAENLGTGSGAAVQYQDEGTNLGTVGTVDTVDFTGAAVVASRAGNKVTVNVTGGGGQATIQFKDEGTNLGATGTVDAVNFTGTGVTATRTGNQVDVSIPSSSTSPFTIGGFDSCAIVKAQNLTGAVWLFGFQAASITGAWPLQSHAVASAFGRMTRLQSEIATTSTTNNIIPSNWVVVVNNDGTQTWQYEWIFGTGNTINTSQSGQVVGLYAEIGGTGANSFGTYNSNDQICLRRNAGESNWTFAHNTGSGAITSSASTIAYAANQKLRFVLTCRAGGNIDFLLQSLDVDMKTVLASSTYTTTGPIPANGTTMWPTIGQATINTFPSAPSPTPTMWFSSMRAVKSGYN